MFGRRKMAPAIPAFDTAANVNPSAAAAAAQAFLARQSSTTSLSTAAAAAALRSRPMTPTAVADIQTKRTMRRSKSNSSMGSSVAGSVQGRPVSQLERKLSNSSMTERTFRDPSPHRGSVRSSMDYAPPVPSIPESVQSTETSPQRRTASLDAPNMRLSSPPLKPNGRGASLGPMAGAQKPTRINQRASSSSLQMLTGSQRLESRGSVNFSYPTSTRRAFSAQGYRTLTSPTPSQSQRGDSIQNQNLVYDPNTRSFRPQAELLFLEQRIRDVADRPVKTMRKVAPQGGAGTHLADGTIGGRPRGTAVDAIERKATPKPAETSPPPATRLATLEATRRKKKRPILTDSHQLVSSPTDSDTSERRTDYSSRAAQLLAKKPSVIREQDEEEREDDHFGKNTDRHSALRKLESRPETGETSPLPTPAGRDRGQGKAAVSLANAPTQQESRSISLPSPAAQVTIPDTFHEADSIGLPNGGFNGKESTSQKPDRVQSISPVRSAHFLPSPEGATSLVVRHQPLGRSISPRKSAMKQPPSPRGSSPAVDQPISSGHGRGPSTSEISDTSTAISDDRLIQRKKLVRVSFDDDRNVVLGRADPPVSPESTVVQSPQYKRNWFGGTGRGKNKDTLTPDEEPDEFMAPRPALPSFGSIREKTRRGSDDYPVLNSLEPVAISSSPSLSATPTGESVDHSVGISSDDVVGAIVAQDLAAKNEANDLKPQEPLAPKVTSREPRVYDSDSGSSTHSTVKFVKVARTLGQSDSVKQGPDDGAIEVSQALSSSSPETEDLKDTKITANGNGNIPTLSITQASPVSERLERYGAWPNIPGGFPVSNSESGQDGSTISVVDHLPTDPTPAAIGIAEPEPTGNLQGGPLFQTAQSTKSKYSTSAETDSDVESVYSDAAEDLSDLEGNGFMSLDAIVESPVVPDSAILALTTPPESPTVRSVMDKAQRKSSLSQQPTQPAATQSWDKAQQYWSELTIEKKRQMERVVQDTPSDSEEEKPAPKLTKKVIVTSPRENRESEDDASYKLNRTYQILPGTKAGPDGQALRSSLRSPPPGASDGFHMRSSMRDAGSGSLRGSMRGSSGAAISQPKGSLQKKFRPISLPVEAKPDPFQRKSNPRNLSSEAAGTALTHHATTKPAQGMPKLRRTGSDGSESSFKRSRSSTGEGYTMKRSMRGSAQQLTMRRPQSPDSTTSQPKPSRFSLRSFSPTESGNRKPVNASGPPLSMSRMTMRDSRRSSNDSNTPSLRSSNIGPGKSPMRLFGKSRSEVKAMSALRSSRFEDSSDEDEVRTGFRSRYADSSDGEDVSPIPKTSFRSTTLRGIPRQPGAVDGDSSDLPDTDDEKPARPSNAKKATKLLSSSSPAVNGTSASQPLRRSGSGRDLIRATPIPTSIPSGSPPVRPDKRKGSFMSILRRKQDPSSKVRKSEAESAARRDTPLERSRTDLLAVKNQDSPNSSASPRLQKRSQMLNRATSDSWPLPTSDDERRPVTSDGFVGDEEPRPGLGSRRGTGAESVDVEPNLPRKKKRFGALRRAFGLDE